MASSIDTAQDAEPDANADAAEPMVAVADDAGVELDAAVDDAATVASVLGAPAFDTASGSAAETEPAVDGAPTTAGTAANLLAYFPAGHVITALVRFDRVRGTEWGPITEKLLQPLPDYKLVFGARNAQLVDKFDTLVISSPSPKDMIATTIVGHTTLTRPQLRALLDTPATPVAWSAAKGGLLGRRTGTLPQGDTRVFLSPFAGWFLLAQPGDLRGLTTATRGNIDRAEATAALPAWLGSIRSIEKESGDTRGPALVVTAGFQPSRRPLPPGADIMLGVKSVPMPDRVSVAMELVTQGWLVRGNLRFARESDATELVTAVATAQQRVKDSRLLAVPLKQQHVYNAIIGLSLQRTGVRVSYATSISIADARVLLAATATALDDYFAKPAAP
jgi:hypothetical protein